MQQMAWTLFWRIISASDKPSSAVLIAPARVTNMAPPASTCAEYAVCGVDERRSVEVAEVMPEKGRNRAR